MNEAPSNCIGSARPRPGLVSAILLLGLLIASPAHADEFLDRLNALFADVRESNRSDPIILSALAELEDAPATLRRQRDAALYPTTGGAWSELSDWASSDTQAAALEALDRVTQEMDYRRALVFAQPYGIDALGADDTQIEFIASGLYTDIGDPPLIAAAQHLYLGRFDDLAKLAHVEATRRADEGDFAGALDVLTDLVHFCRQILDREFFAEKQWAMGTAILALERVRDVVYLDARDNATLTSDDLKTIIERLADDRGPISLDRARLPRGDFIGTEQLIASVMDASGGVRADVFASTMARMQSTDRPLRLFGEAARWRDAAALHTRRAVTEAGLQDFRGDYEFRWDRSPFDPMVARPFAVEGFAGNPNARLGGAVIAYGLPDLRDLFSLRQILRTELIGARNALGLVAFNVDNATFPLDLSAIRPAYVDELGVDPFNPDQARGRIPPLEFFVPIRDTADRTARRPTPPHQISILVEGEPNVSILVRDDEFVLFSVGADGADQWADEVQNALNAAPGRDFLLWPPVLSVIRNALDEGGRFN